MTRPRPALVIALAVAVAGAGVAAALPTVQEHLDRPSREQAQSVAHALAAPAGATTSTVCRGDGQVACWETSASVVDVAREMSLALQEEAGKAATSGCDQVPILAASAADEEEVLADSCFVRVRFGEHGTFVFVDPLTDYDETTRTASVIGARISLSAA